LLRPFIDESCYLPICALLEFAWIPEAFFLTHLISPSLCSLRFFLTSACHVIHSSSTAYLCSESSPLYC
jgi:hypothetical protein